MAEDFSKFVRDQLNQHTPKETIKATLKAGGWNDADIDKVFADVEAHPLPPGASPYSSSPIIVASGNSNASLIFMTCIVGLAGFFGINYLHYGTLWGPLLDSVKTPFLEDSGTQTVETPADQQTNNIPVTGPAVKQGSAAISDDDKEQISIALYTLKSVLGLNNAGAIRNYLIAGALPSSAQDFSAMNNSSILQYASSLLATLNGVTPAVLSSQQTVLLVLDPSTVQATIATSQGTIQRTVRKVNGVWY